MRGIWIEMKRVLLGAGWGVMPLAADADAVKLHEFNGIVELRLDSKWELTAEPTRGAGGRLVSIAVLSPKKAGNEAVLHLALELPRQDLVKGWREGAM